MRVYQLKPRDFAANTYFLTADDRTAVVIDPARPQALDEANRLGLRAEFVLLTHGHFDHVGGCAALQGAGAKIGCLVGEEETALRRNLGVEFGHETAPFTMDFTFRGGEILSLAGISFQVLATPGHTAGSCCFLVKGERDLLFTGDTLFRGGFGRTDLPTGDRGALQRSLALLFTLGDADVFPGHGENTTLFDEKTHNGW